MERYEGWHYGDFSQDTIDVVLTPLVDQITTDTAKFANNHCPFDQLFKEVSIYVAMNQAVQRNMLDRPVTRAIMALMDAVDEDNVDTSMYEDAEQTKKSQIYQVIQLAKVLESHASVAQRYGGNIDYDAMIRKCHEFMQKQQEILNKEDK